MPGRIEQVDGQWILHWGSRTYRHKSKADALRQMRALYANDPDVKKLDLVAPAGNEALLVDRAVQHASPIGLDPFAVTLVQPVGQDSRLYVQVSSSAPAAVTDMVTKLLTSGLPEAEILPLEKLSSEKADLLFARPLYRLGLSPATRAGSVVTTKSVVDGLWSSAALASRVFKADRVPRVPFRVVKAGEQPERIVTGVVLEPDVVDGTKTTEGGEVVAEGDTYSAIEIQKAMYWWMEKGGRAFSYHHIGLGGKPLGPDDVVVLENWQVRADYREGTQPIRTGTWMLSARINYAPLWNDIMTGAINSWSIGANALGQIEELPADSLPVA